MSNITVARQVRARRQVADWNQSVDDIVHNQVHYVNICEEQSAIFRQNVDEFTKEYALYLESPDVAKPGQQWQPTLGDRNAYIEEMKRRCRIVPRTIADRIKIYCAAHAILACTVFVDMAQHTQKSQLKILARTSEQCRASLTASSATQLHSEPVVTSLTKSAQARPTRRITPDDIVLFRRDPTTLVNKEFVFNAGDELYEIMEASFAAGGWSYKVRFEGCVDSVNFSIDTMIEMLEESRFVTV